MRKDVVVLGLGNPLMSDEGVGAHIIGRFLAQADKYPFAEFIDAGTGGAAILHLIAGREKAVLIDCAQIGTEPGAIKRFMPEEVKSLKRVAHQSLHEGDILDIIRMSRQLGQQPKEIVLFGIEPQTVGPGLKLSDTVKKRLDDYVTVISEELTL